MCKYLLSISSLDVSEILGWDIKLGMASTSSKKLTSVLINIYHLCNDDDESWSEVTPA